MKTIHKYAIPMYTRFYIDLPKGAVPIHAAAQINIPQMWVIVEFPDDKSNVEHERQWFGIRRAGQPFDGTEGRHIATFFHEGGALVWHLFELVEV